MNALILWLSRRKHFTAVITLGYIIVNILCHDVTQALYKKAEKLLSLEIMNAVVIIVCLIILGGFSWAAIKQNKSGTHRALKLTYGIFTAVLIMASSNTLIAKNVELIHFPQYALLVIPVFALTMRFGETVAFVTLLGAADEAYQYLVLHRSWVGIYDFNDVILNLIGAGAGIVLILVLADLEPSSNPGSTYSLRDLVRSVGLMTTGILILSGLLMYATGLLQLFPGDNAPHALILLNRGVPPSGFWQQPLPSLKRFHILHPGEGILLVAVLTTVYVWLDFRIEFKKRNDETA